jgi:hypothetical protein
MDFMSPTLRVSEEWDLEEMKGKLEALKRAWGPEWVVEPRLKSSIS